MLAGIITAIQQRIWRDFRLDFSCSLCIGARRDFAVWFRLIFHCCLWQETLFGSLPVLSALPSEEEDLRGLDRSGNVALVVKVRFAGDASE